MISINFNRRQPPYRRNASRSTSIRLPRKVGLSIFLVMSIIFLIIGTYLIAKDYNAQKNWLQIEGEITISEVYRTTGSGSGSNKPTYGPDLEYRYIFGEKEYLGHCCEESSSSISKKKKMVDHNPVGSKVEVLVNPEEPYTSLLKEGADPFRLGNLLFTGFSLLFVIIGIILLFQKSRLDSEDYQKDNPSQTINETNQTVKNDKIKN
ncbi:DUF3592 domain-containing protein [Candidatus Woesearchaeota archaeon]|nr:DUF3592 domain-containing protein [Candidatus Woesearchaeota archaeon]